MFVIGYTGLVWADSINWTIGKSVAINQNYGLLDYTGTITIMFSCQSHRAYKNVGPVELLFSH